MPVYHALPKSNKSPMTNVGVGSISKISFCSARTNERFAVCDIREVDERFHGAEEQADDAEMFRLSLPTSFSENIGPDVDVSMTDRRNSATAEYRSERATFPKSSHTELFDIHSSGSHLQMFFPDHHWESIDQHCHSNDVVALIR